MHLSRNFKLALCSEHMIFVLKQSVKFDPTICFRQWQVLPIKVAARSKAGTVFARSNAEIVCSNPTQGMDVCIVCVYSVFVLFCVSVEALRWADPPSKETYRLCIGSRN
jgi:hypothetical protein